MDDDININSGTCTSDPKIECFFQVLALHREEDERLKTRNIHFSQNYANSSCSTLYGGLFDRCAVSQFAEQYRRYAYDYKDRGGGIACFKRVSSTANILSVSSHPVQVCLCINNEYDCTYHDHTLL